MTTSPSSSQKKRLLHEKRQKLLEKVRGEALLDVDKSPVPSVASQQKHRSKRSDSKLRKKVAQQIEQQEQQQERKKKKDRPRVSFVYPREANETSSEATPFLFDSLREKQNISDETRDDSKKKKSSSRKSKSSSSKGQSIDDILFGASKQSPLDENAVLDDFLYGTSDRSPDAFETPHSVALSENTQDLLDRSKKRVSRAEKRARKKGLKKQHDKTTQSLDKAFDETRVHRSLAETLESTINDPFLEKHSLDSSRMQPTFAETLDSSRMQQDTLDSTTRFHTKSVATIDSHTSKSGSFNSKTINSLADSFDSSMVRKSLADAGVVDPTLKRTQSSTGRKSKDPSTRPPKTRLERNEPKRTDGRRPPSVNVKKQANLFSPLDKSPAAATFASSKASRAKSLDTALYHKSLADSMDTKTIETRTIVDSVDESLPKQAAWTQQQSKNIYGSNKQETKTAAEIVDMKGKRRHRKKHEQVSQQPYMKPADPFAPMPTPQSSSKPVSRVSGNTFAAESTRSGPQQRQPFPGVDNEDRVGGKISGLSVDDAVRDEFGCRPRANSTDGELNLPRRGLCDERKVLEAHKWNPDAHLGSPRGFVNLGNTCFLNSTLQCLAYLPPFCQCLLALPSDSGKNGKYQKLSQGQKITSMLRSLFHQIQSTTGNSAGPIAPRKLVKALPTVGTCGSRNGYKFRPGRQEDAHEFLVHLLDAMNDGELRAAGIDQHASGWRDRLPIPRLDETTFVHRVFGGYLRSQVRCTVCGHRSNTYDPFLNLSLEVSKKSSTSIATAISEFTRKETLDSANRWKCSGCKKRVCAIKQLTVFRPPLSLCIQLKRFAFGGNGGRGFGHYSGRGGLKITKPIEFFPEMDLPLSDGRSCGYVLTGIVIHVGGSSSSGHYTAYVRKPGKSGGTQWYRMDDSFVEAVSERTVLKQKDAYLLFYLRKEVQLEFPSPPMRTFVSPEEAQEAGRARAKARADFPADRRTASEPGTPSSGRPPILPRGYHPHHAAIKAKLSEVSILDAEESIASERQGFQEDVHKEKEVSRKPRTPAGSSKHEVYESDSSSVESLTPRREPKSKRDSRGHSVCESVESPAPAFNKNASLGLQDMLSAAATQGQQVFASMECKGLATSESNAQPRRKASSNGALKGLAAAASQDQEAHRRISLISPSDRLKPAVLKETNGVDSGEPKTEPTSTPAEPKREDPLDNDQPTETPKEKKKKKTRKSVGKSQAKERRFSGSMATVEEESSSSSSSSSSDDSEEEKNDDGSSTSSDESEPEKADGNVVSSSSSSSSSSESEDKKSSGRPPRDTKRATKKPESTKVSEEDVMDEFGVFSPDSKKRRPFFDSPRSSASPSTKSTGEVVKELKGSDDSIPPFATFSPPSKKRRSFFENESESSEEGSEDSAPSDVGTAPEGNSRTHMEEHDYGDIQQRGSGKRTRVVLNQLDARGKVEVMIGPRYKSKAWKPKKSWHGNKGSSFSLLGNLGVDKWKQEKEDGSEASHDRVRLVRQMEDDEQSKKRKMHLDRWDTVLDQGKQKKVRRKGSEDADTVSDVTSVTFDPKKNVFQRIQSGIQKINRGRAKGAKGVFRRKNKGANKGQSRSFKRVGSNTSY